jgi:hypothetical protein
MLRQQGDCFLDDMSPSELEEKLHTRIRFVADGGADLVDALLL